jgi:hypothetical protein
MYYKNFLLFKKVIIVKYLEAHSLLKKKNYYNINNYNLFIFFNFYGWTKKKLNYNLQKIKEIRK